jgi:hypothetical protein
LCLPQLCISVLIFVLLCRSLGLDTRVVLNFDISPLKPTNEDLAAALGSAKLTNKAVASALGSVKTEESSQKGAKVFPHFFSALASDLFLQPRVSIVELESSVPRLRQILGS